MSATHRAITARWFRRVRPPSSTAQDGTTSLTLVPQCGMAGLTPTAWEQDSPIQLPPAGALASGTVTATIRGTTPGGDRWAITAAAGIRTTAGARGVERQLPTCTESGATQRIRAPERPGPILTPAIMA